MPKHIKNEVTGKTERVYSLEEFKQSYERGRADAGLATSSLSEYTKEDVTNAFKEGMENGKKLIPGVAEASYEQGFKDGKKASKEDAHNSFASTLEAEKNKVRRSSHLEGYELGKNEGYQKGLKESFVTGFDAGREHEKQRFMKFGPSLYYRHIAEKKVTSFFNAVHTAVSKSSPLPTRQFATYVAAPFALGLFAKHVMDNRQRTSHSPDTSFTEALRGLSC